MDRALLSVRHCDLGPVLVQRRESASHDPPDKSCLGNVVQGPFRVAAEQGSRIPTQLRRTRCPGTAGVEKSLTVVNERAPSGQWQTGG